MLVIDIGIRLRNTYGEEPLSRLMPFVPFLLFM